MKQNLAAGDKMCGFLLTKVRVNPFSGGLQKIVRNFEPHYFII